MDTSNSLNDTMTSNKSIETPALGKFWRSACAMRLLITEVNSSNITSSNDSNHNNNNNSMRIIRIIKCNQLKCETKCSVNITDTGVI